MNIYKIHFEIIFSIIKKQNEDLLKDICSQENINGNILKEFIPSKKQLKLWFDDYSKFNSNSDLSDSSDSSESDSS